jgi:hypothetical protein
MVCILYMYAFAHKLQQRPDEMMRALLVGGLLACCSAFFPDLSSYPNDTTVLALDGMGITDIPVGAFARFTQLQKL